MASITTINSSDLITDSRAVINTNFANLNADKIETSYIDTDTTLASNSDTKIPSQKAVKAYVDSRASAALSTEFTASATHSLTTDGSQRVLVTAKGFLTISIASSDITLVYNGVTKDMVTAGNAGAGASQNVPFCLTYTETPSAATANITVATSAGSISNVVIMVTKFNV